MRRRGLPDVWPLGLVPVDQRPYSFPASAKHARQDPSLLPYLIEMFQMCQGFRLTDQGLNHGTAIACMCSALFIMFNFWQIMGTVQIMQAVFGVDWIQR